MFSEDCIDFDALATIREFMQFVNSISSIGLHAENDNTILMHYVLDFFDVVSGLMYACLYAISVQSMQ